MKKNKIKYLVGLIIVLTMAEWALAGDSVSLSISCTIPAIPGVNAPLIEEQTLKTETKTTAEEAEKKEDASDSELPKLFQVDEEQETRLVKNSGEPLIVKTFYTR